MPVNEEDLDDLIDNDDSDQDADDKDADGDDADDKQSDKDDDKFASLMAKIDSLEQRLTAPKDDDTDQDKEPKDKTYGFDPAKMVEASATLGTQTMRALRKAESELREQFGGDLPKETYDEILDQLSGLPPEEIIKNVGKQTHMAMGMAHYGSLVKAGKIKVGEKPRRQPTPIGGSEPREVDESSKAVGLFEKLYGKIKSKRQKARLMELGEKIG